MPNASVRANAQSMSRRLFLAAGPATAIFATLRGARGKPVSALEQAPINLYRIRRP